MADETAGTRRPQTELIARNIRARRRECGLSLEGVAKRSGLTDVWLAAVEEGMAIVSHTSLARLAVALDTSVDRLAGVEETRTPAPEEREAQETAAANRGLESMAETECYARLALHSVGRISPAHGDLFILPVDYLLDGRDIVFRTAAGSSPAGAEGTVAFEVDDLLVSARLGWSVLVIGAAEQVTGEAELERLSKLGQAPWPDEAEHPWIRIKPLRVTGRRVTPRTDQE